MEGAPALENTAEANGLRAEDASPSRILDIGYAFWRSKALLSAVELDVFTILAEGPQHLDSLVGRVGIHERGARDFFDALVALGLLYRDGKDRYGNSADCDRYLDRRKPSYLGELLTHLNVRHYQNWGSLTRALRTGAPQSKELGLGSYRALYDDRPTQEIFLNGMTAGSLLAAQALAKEFPWRDYRTIIDIGTAQGCLPVEIVSVHPHLTGGGFDLPAIEPIFMSYIRKHGLSDRLQFYPGDFFSDPLPRGRRSRHGTHPAQLGSSNQDNAVGEGPSGAPSGGCAHRVRSAHRRSASRPSSRAAVEPQHADRDRGRL